MTVIAYRWGEMACDSCWATGGTQDVSANKILRMSSGALLGCAGDNDTRDIYDLLDKVRKPEQLPSRKALAETKCEFEGLIAFPRGGVWKIVTGRHDETGYPLDYDGSTMADDDFGCWQAATMGGYAACGSGGDLALGAMAGNTKLSAREAVLVACKHSIHCRTPVHVFRVEIKKKR